MIENAIDKKVKRLGKLTKTIKRKRAVFETFLKSRLSYAAQEISYIFPHYKNKWISMIYRVLKTILNISQNIKKEDLLKVMSIRRENDKKRIISFSLIYSPQMLWN